MNKIYKEIEKLTQKNKHLKFDLPGSHHKFILTVANKEIKKGNSVLIITDSFMAASHDINKLNVMSASEIEPPINYYLIDQNSILNVYNKIFDVVLIYNIPRIVNKIDNSLLTILTNNKLKYSLWINRDEGN